MYLFQHFKHESKIDETYINFISYIIKNNKDFKLIFKIYFYK